MEVIRTEIRTTDVYFGRTSYFVVVRESDGREVKIPCTVVEYLMFCELLGMRGMIREEKGIQ